MNNRKKPHVAIYPTAGLAALMGPVVQFFPNYKRAKAAVDKSANPQAYVARMVPVLVRPPAAPTEAPPADPLQEVVFKVLAIFERDNPGVNLGGRYALSRLVAEALHLDSGRTQCENCHQWVHLKTTGDHGAFHSDGRWDEVTTYECPGCGHPTAE